MKIFGSKLIVLLFLSLIIFSACDRNPFKINVSEIPLPKVKIHDYGTALFSLNRDSLESGLSGIQKDFSLFLGNEPLIDEQILQLGSYVNDPFLNELYKAYQNSFPSLDLLETETSIGFQHLLYYFPNTKVPELYSYISGVHDPIIYQDNILVLGLDNYLGSDSKIYTRIGTPRYKIRSMSPQYVLRDVFSALGQEKIAAPTVDGNVIDFMIYEAKNLFFIKSMLPSIQDSVLLNYSDEQLKWFDQKEKELWKYYIENEVLFKSDYDSMKKFINDAPFTPDLGNDSPPRTGVWLGYQILLSYAKNNEVSLNDILLNTNSREILNKSKYKPGR